MNGYRFNKGTILQTMKCRWPWPKSLRKNATCRALRLFQPRHGWGSFWSRKCRTGKRLAPDDTMFSCMVRGTETTHESFGKFWLAKNMGPVQQKVSPDFDFEWSNFLLAILAHMKYKIHPSCFFSPNHKQKTQPKHRIESPSFPGGSRLIRVMGSNSKAPMMAWA